MPPTCTPALVRAQTHLRVTVWLRGRLLSLVLLILTWPLAFASVQAQTLPLAPHLIGLDSAEGRAMLMRDTTTREAYWPLSLQFVTQKEPAYCGVATLVMVLNALGVPAPTYAAPEPFRAYTQDNLYTPATEAVLPQAVLVRNGMTLDQLGRLVEVHGLVAEVRHADESSVAQFRTQAQAALATPGQHVAVNYLRATLGQQSGGHISPLAAFDAATDRFLVMDVSRYKYPPVWVSTETLFAAMDSVDANNAGRRRGYVLIRR